MGLGTFPGQYNGLFLVLVAVSREYSRMYYLVQDQRGVQCLLHIVVGGNNGLGFLLFRQHADSPG